MAKSSITPIPMEEFAAPAQRALEAAGFTNLEKLSTAREAEVKALHGIGPNAVKKLKELLSKHNLSFSS